MHTHTSPEESIDNGAALTTQDKEDAPARSLTRIELVEFEHSYCGLKGTSNGRELMLRLLSAAGSSATVWWAADTTHLPESYVVEVAGGSGYDPTAMARRTTSLLQRFQREDRKRKNASPKWSLIFAAGLAWSRAATGWLLT